MRILRTKLKPSTRARLKPPPKKADPFYLSPEWRGLMDQIIRERGRICEDPLHKRGTPRTGVRIFGDHIIEKKDVGPLLDKANVMLRCGACHTRKTMQARAARRMAIDQG